MKKLIPLFPLLLAAVIFSYGGSCESPNGYIIYQISADLNGIPNVWKLGISDIEPKAFGQLYNTGSFTGIEFFATTETVSKVSLLPENYVWIDIATTKTAPTRYTIAEAYGWIRKDGTYWAFTSITLEITSFGPVGSAIQGTFLGTVTDGSTTITVTNGQFDLVRIPNNSW